MDPLRVPGQDRGLAGSRNRFWFFLSILLLAGGIVACIATVMNVVQRVDSPPWQSVAWLAGGFFGLSWPTAWLGRRHPNP